MASPEFVIIGREKCLVLQRVEHLILASLPSDDWDCYVPVWLKPDEPEARHHTVHPNTRSRLLPAEGFYNRDF